MKDIYIIRNTINNMVYVGQSKNPHRRFIEHKCYAKNHLYDRSVLYDDMIEYGVNNFYYEILEKDVNNPDEREKFWISKLNSLYPNGYNIAIGGMDYPHYKSYNSPSAQIKNLEELKDIIYDIENSELTLVEISKKYHISVNTISALNNGYCYRDEFIDYPIRKFNANRKLTDGDIFEIVDLLKNSNISFADIANIFGVSEVTINSIDKGYTNTKLTNCDYPIRKFRNSRNNILTDSQIEEIINLLKTTTLSMREIGKKFNVGHHTISSINSGSIKYYRQGNKYPIR